MAVKKETWRRQYLAELGLAAGDAFVVVGWVGQEAIVWCCNLQYVPTCLVPTWWDWLEQGPVQFHSLQYVLGVNPSGRTVGWFCCLVAKGKWLDSVILKCKTLLRGPVPKKWPMTSVSKIELADFYLPSRGYQILFKNDFLLFQFGFKPKILSRKLFLSDSSKIRPKISPCKKEFRNHYRKYAIYRIKKTTQCWRRKPFNAMSFYKYRKTAEAIKKLSLKHCIVN